ncbi:hypothetical protein AB1K89_10890 [Sporosarcina sp. 179-K 8C2 HS]|uniref:YqgU-like beta propeller domain-containing protein n=1 Tax=Sporosarcina sp. 179-K 8C2 HS TaxID=3142387 RepID=UPI0039A3E72F
MKKGLCLIAMLIFVLYGCAEQKNPPSVQPDMEESFDIAEEPFEPPSPHVFKADPSKFHFIADWLTDTQILYVEKNDGFYTVNYFDIETGESGLVYEDESFIIDVLVHPSGDYLLIHTSEHPTTAAIKIVGKDGAVQHQVEIDSTELGIEWNRTDPKKILFTAFHEDWSYDLFVFDGNDDSLSIVELDDPFPKWAGENRIMTLSFRGHPLDGGDIEIFHMEDGEIETTEIGNAIYFDVLEDSIVSVQSVDAGAFAYTIRKLDGTVAFGWTLPAVSNYSEWIVPSIEWLDEKSLIVIGAEKSGQLDEMESGFNMYFFEKGNSELIIKGLDAGPIKCSPSAKYCLSGYSSDELIDVEAKEKLKWIKFDN